LVLIEGEHSVPVVEAGADPPGDLLLDPIHPVRVARFAYGRDLHLKHVAVWQYPVVEPPNDFTLRVEAAGNPGRKGVLDGEVPQFRIGPGRPAEDADLWVRECHALLSVHAQAPAV
jgi:hypothetical protein